MQRISNNNKNMQKEKTKQIISILIVSTLIIGGIFLLKDSKPPQKIEKDGIPVTTLSPINNEDMLLGSRNAEISVIVYADFQCPFCGAVTGLQEKTAPAVKYLEQRDSSWLPYLSGIKTDYIESGKVNIIYRDFAFLGPESQRSAEAARCAGEQNNFWEYHDYLFTHQKGENEGYFGDENLKLFAKELGLDSSLFDECLDSNKYTEMIIASKEAGSKAGVSGTPKGFIIKDGKIVGMIDGAESYKTVKEKIDNALK